MTDDEEAIKKSQRVSKECSQRIEVLKSIAMYSEDADEREKSDKMQAVVTAHAIEFDLLQNIKYRRSHWGKKELADMIKNCISGKIAEKRIEIESYWKVMRRIEKDKS
jgi:hypothetical protein